MATSFLSRSSVGVMGCFWTVSCCETLRLDPLFCCLKQDTFHFSSVELFLVG